MADIDPIAMQEALNELATKFGMTSAQANSVISSLNQLSARSNLAAGAATGQAGALSGSTTKLYAFQNALSSLGDVMSSAVKTFVRVPYDMANTSDAYDGASAAINRYTEVLDQVGKALQTTGTALLITLPGLNVAFNALSEVIGGVVGIGKEQLANQMSQMQKLTNVMQGLSAAGVTFGHDFQAARQAASAAGLSLDTFSRSLIQNADKYAQLGSGILLAGVQIGKTVNNFDDGVLTMLGGFEGATEAVADYMVTQQQLGINAFTNQQQLLASSQSYLASQKELQYITGKSIKQQNDELARRANQAAYQSMVAKMTVDERKNFNVALQQLPPMLQEAFVDMTMAAKTGQTAINRTTLALQAMNPEVVKTLQGLVTDLNVDPEVFLKNTAESMGAVVTQTQDAAKNMNDIFYMMAARPEAFSNAQVFKVFETSVAEVGQASGKLSGAVVATAEAIAQVKATLMDIADYGKIFVGLQRSLENTKNTVEGITVELFRPTAELIKYTYTVAQAQAEILRTTLSSILELLPRDVQPREIDKNRYPLAPPRSAPPIPTEPPAAPLPRPQAEPPAATTPAAPVSQAPAVNETQAAAGNRPSAEFTPMVLALANMYDEERRQTDLLNRIHNALA